MGPNANPNANAHPDPMIEDVAPTTAIPVAPRRVETPRGRVGLRWAIALVVVALLAASSAAGAWFLAGQSGASSLAGWVPSDSVAYAEARLDLPGDQRQQLGNFLAHFPGFKDQSTLDDKIAEALDRAIGSKTNGQHDYSTDIRPWFGGEAAAALGVLPTLTEKGSDNFPREARYLLLASMKDAAATEAWVAKLAGQAQPAPTTGTYAGTTLRTTTTPRGESVSVAVLDRVLLAGDTASVKAAIDTHGASGLAANAEFSAAVARLGGDHLGFGWLDARAYAEWAMKVAAARGAAGAADTKLLDLVPEWVGGDLRATHGDALTARSVAPHVSGVPVVASGPATLAAHVPASAFLFLDTRDAATALRFAIDQWRSTPSAANVSKSLDQALAVFGGEDAAIGWIGETAIAAVPDGSGAAGGTLVVAKDQAKAEAFVRQIRNLIALGASSAGITSRDEDHAGTTITIVATDAAGGAAVAGMSVPSHLELAFATRGDLVVAGTPAFVRAALDTTQGASLASSSRYTDALARVGGDAAGSGWVDISAIRGILERVAPAGADRTRYEQEIRPYLEPLDVLVFAHATASDVDTGTMSLIVK